MIIEFDQKKVKLPDFLIVGAERAGTTSLHYYLSQHPDIYMSLLKELNFFSYFEKPSYIKESVIKRHKKFGSNIKLIDNLNDYTVFFKDASEKQVIGEASVTYLYFYEESIANIKEIYGRYAKDVKIIIILRNPSKRAFSHWSMRIQQGDENLDFIAAIKAINKRSKESPFIGHDYIGFGNYCKQVKAYIGDFQHIKIVLFEDLVSKTYETLKCIFEFLGVKKDFRPHIAPTNPSGIPKNKKLYSFLISQNPIRKILSGLLRGKLKVITKNLISKYMLNKECMTKSERKYLIDIYKDDIKELQSIINRDLSLWLK